MVIKFYCTRLPTKEYWWNKILSLLCYTMGNTMIWRKTMDCLELKMRENQVYLSIDYINKHGGRACLPLANSWYVYFKIKHLFLVSSRHLIYVASLASLWCSLYGLEGREYYIFESPDHSWEVHCSHKTSTDWIFSLAYTILPSQL